MSGQCVAVVSCGVKSNSTLSPQSIIAGVLETDDVASSKSDFFSSFKWNISNKYYDASVDLCLVETKNIISQQFCDEVQAVVAVFDSLKDSKSFEGLDSWLSYIDVWDPEIKLAVCEKCSSVDDTTSAHLNRETVQRWCIDHGFELVETNPVAEDYSEYEDFGIKRITNALVAHMWPNMQLKKQCQTNESNITDDDVAKQEEHGEAEENSAESIQEKIDSLLPHSDELEEDDFEQLFQKMRVFKESASGLSGASRKDYAEKVVTAFWKAMGGDEDELSSNDET